LALTTGWLVKSPGEAHAPTTGTAQPPIQSAPNPAPPPASERVPPQQPVEPPPQFATDDKGFVNSNARCEGSQEVVALGRTERSIVVICGSGSGQYEYRGLRLSDDAMLKTAAVTTPTHEFLARNAGVVYAVSPTELTVTAGDTLIKKEPMLEFRASHEAGQH
jgi:hypothetical protein